MTQRGVLLAKHFSKQLTCLKVYDLIIRLRGQTSTLKNGSIYSLKMVRIIYNFFLMIREYIYVFSDHKKKIVYNPNHF